jgi:hypothetical protein
VWVSYSGGQNWQNLNTDYQLPFLGVSSIAIDRDHPEIIFLGTGDVDSEFNYSSGIYRSTDGGQNWEQAGLNWILTHFTIGKVLLHPTDSSIAFAATTLGIYKTENRNAQNPSWMKVYPALAEDFEYIRNMAFHPANPQRLYATGIDIVSSSENGNLNTWNRIANAQNGLDFTNTPWPLAFGGEEYVSGLNMAIAPQGDFLYINCVSRDTPPPFNWQSATYFHFYSYDIANDAWTNIPTTGLFDGSAGPGITGGRTEMTVSPINSSLLYCGGVALYRFNMDLPDEPWARVLFNAHVDYHELTFSPFEENVLFAGTDGGLFKKDLSDFQYAIDGVEPKQRYLNPQDFYGTSNGHPTVELNNGLGVSTLYNFSSSPLDANQILTGHQDCGLFYYKNYQWSSVVNNADGFECLMDDTDIDLMYATKPWPSNGTILRSENNCLNPTWDILLTGASPINEPSWFGAALVSDPFNAKTLFQARLNLWKVDDASTASIQDWYKISNVNQEVPPSWGNNNCVIWALEIAPSNADYLYFSGVKLSSWVTEFDAVRIFKTTSGGGILPESWIDITPPTPGNTEGTYFVSDIAVSSSDPNQIWISYSGYLENYKIKHFDGNTWTDYNEGLPNLPVNCIVYQSGSDDGLFVGTDAGVYYRDASLTQWQAFSENLPAAIVNWLEINYSNQKLRAGTYGRGLWETDLPEGNTASADGKVNLYSCSPENQFTIFPNPNPGFFSVKNYTGAKILQISVFDMHGAAIHTETSHHSNSLVEVKLNERKSGIYCVQIETEDGHTIKKMVLELKQ